MSDQDYDDCPYCDPPFRYEPEPPRPPIENLSGLEKVRRAVKLSRGTYAAPTRPILFARDDGEPSNAPTSESTSA